MTRWLKRLALLALALVAVTLVAELVFRAFVTVAQVGPVFTTYEEDVGLANRRSQDGIRTTPEYEVRVRTNALGLRGSVETEPKKPPGVRRILCLGDSFTFGKGVADDETVPARLAVRLAAPAGPRTEVLNAGVVSYGASNEWIWWQARGAALEPDLLVLQLCPNDFGDDASNGVFALADDGTLLDTHVGAYERLKRATRAYESLPFRGLLDRSYLFNHFRIPLNRALLKSRAPPEEAEADPAAAARARADSRTLTSSLVRRLLEDARGRRVATMVLLFDQRPGDAALLTRTALEAGAAVLDLGPLAAERPELYYPLDGHWRAAGAEFVAARVHEFLLAKGLVAR